MIGTDAKDATRQRSPVGGRTPASRVAIALLHHPVYDRSRSVVTSSLTSVDLHDIARTARCYAVEPFYVVTPVAAQREMARRIVAHWLDEQDAPHPRAEALACVRVCESLDATLRDLAGECGATPFWAVTGASLDQGLTSFQDLRAAVHGRRHPAVLLVFGTGWGLSRDLTRAAPCRLEPIRGLDGFNHLPVRAAVAIVLDRLLGLRVS